MSPDTKLYMHRCIYASCPERWSKFPTNEAEHNHIEKSVLQDPIVHRHIFDDHKWQTESFTIQSSPMRAAISTVLDKYQDLDLDVEKWTFKPPFMPLVHRWDRLLSLREDEDQEHEPEAIAQLLEFLTPILAPKVDALVNTRKTGNVMFDDLWQIFPPHEFVITKFYGVEAIREQMIERGRKFEALRGYHFQTCSGSKILLPPGKSEERPVCGRVIVDAHAYYMTNDIVKPDLAPLVDEDQVGQKKRSDEAKRSNKKKPKAHECDWACDGECRGDEDDDSEDSDTPQEDTPVEGNAEMTVKAPKHTTGRSENLEPLTDDMCLVATPWLKGFDLKTKDWAQFYIDDLTPVVWNDAAFNHLVLPGTEKQLAWEFVENKTLANSFDDFIQDKGRGIIILMFGPPGVGKTYTAEAVAEKARVPLYSMSAGDLGTVPKEVELALDRALTLCGLWNAMLLLDEADVFLGARTDSDLARNELVAVFLTKLEYYTGVCFLTTNRTASIDTAFQSRVDLFLPYKDLTFEARKKVWQNFINRARGTQVEIPTEDMNKLAEMKLNGREIKNLIKSAHLLGLKNGGAIQVDRLMMLARNRVAALGELKKN
ncbi:Fidgetin 1 [Fusarium coicis]|nr:Fidgetin 1 [Fusarium coicis]